MTQKGIFNISEANNSQIVGVPDPYRLVGPLESVFGNLFCYRVHSYRRQFSLTKQYFERGDCYQAVISSSVRVRPKMDTYEYFRQVSHRFIAAHYSYWLSVGDVRFFGNCGLPHVEVRNGRSSTRVFAGTMSAVSPMNQPRNKSCSKCN